MDGRSEGGREGKVVKKKNWVHIKVQKSLSCIVTPANDCCMKYIQATSTLIYVTPHHMKCGTGGGVNVL